MNGGSPDRKTGSWVSVRIGRWFEARGAGWGVLVVPALVVLLALLAHTRLVG